MGIFDMFTKEIIELAGDLAEAAVDLTVDVVEEVFDENKVTTTVRDIGYAAVGVTQTTFNRAVDVVDGALDVGIGLIDNDHLQQTEGIDKMVNTVTQTANDIGSGLIMSLETGRKAIEGALKVGEGYFNNDNYKVDEGFEQMGTGAVNLAKVATVGAISFGVMDAVGIIGEDNTSQPVPLETASLTEHANIMYNSQETEGFFNAKPAEASEIPPDAGAIDGLLPSADIEQINGVDNGMADPSATNELIELGCREDANHVPSPDRDATAREAFLHKFGYKDCPAGYEVHHIVPLYAGGADSPENMVLVTIEQHDKITAAEHIYYKEKFSL